MDKLEWVDLYAYELSTKCKEALESKFIQKHQCLAFAKDDQSTLHIALPTSNLDSILAQSNPTITPNTSMSSRITLLKSHLQALYPHFHFVFFQASQEAFDFQALQIAHHQEFTALLQAFQNEHINPSSSQNAQESSLLRLLDFILHTCIQEGASDIHFEKSSFSTQVRIRVDGMLRKRFSLEAQSFDALSSRLKLECELDVNENRKSQDGRFAREFNSQSFDFRLSSVPSFEGESIVIRILSKSVQNLNLTSLGFSHAQLACIQQNIHLPHGIIFLTGPTGSGKSTTLYAMLESIKSPNKKIITLEDPIEYHIDLASQVLINPSCNFDFQDALRASLRQDPDVLMVGEIRDEETLQTAIKASLTGHLVLSTLHSNDTLSAVERLLEMGARDYLLTSTLNLIISQRLIRSLCTHCKTPLNPEEIHTKLTSLGFEHLYEHFLNQTNQIYTNSGCQKCNMQGFSGRILISELLPSSPTLREYIKAPHTKEQTLDSLRTQGFHSLFESALECVLAGQSSFEEIIRVCKI